MSGLETELAPGFLVAVPGLPDPNFARTVVLLMEHSDEGAMGLVINRPLNLPLGRLLSEAGVEESGPFSQPVLYGGPVSPSRGWVLHEGSWAMDGTLVVAPGVALSSSVAVLRAIAEGKGPKQFSVCLGYAGWSAGQLEGEIAIGSWVPVPATARLVLEVPLEERWEEALRSNGLEPSMVMSRNAEA